MIYADIMLGLWFGNLAYLIQTESKGFSKKSTLYVYTLLIIYPAAMYILARNFS